jgi:hypothetical protein
LQGNNVIMTHSMVHRTHLDVFEQYYPGTLPAPWIDAWMSIVYGSKRSTQLLDWRIHDHADTHGMRETQHYEMQTLKTEVEKGGAWIKNWLIQTSMSMDFVTKNKYMELCDVFYNTKTKNDLTLPMKPNSLVCARGDTATLTKFFQLNIQIPFTLLTL